MSEEQIREDFQRICKFLGIRPKLELKPDMKSGRFNEQTKTVELGLKIGGRLLIRRMLVHECLHAKGILHNKTSRFYGFYSQLAKDLLSGDIVEWIFCGGRKPIMLTVLEKKW